MLQHDHKQVILQPFFLVFLWGEPHVGRFHGFVIQLLSCSVIYLHFFPSKNKYMLNPPMTPQVSYQTFNCYGPKPQQLDLNPTKKVCRSIPPYASWVLELHLKSLKSLQARGWSSNIAKTVPVFFKTTPKLPSKPLKHHQKPPKLTIQTTKVNTIKNPMKKKLQRKPSLVAICLASPSKKYIEARKLQMVLMQRPGVDSKGCSCTFASSWGTQNHQKPCFWHLKTRFFGGENLCFSWFGVPQVCAINTCSRSKYRL